MKTKRVSWLATACIALLFLTGCQQDDTGESRSEKPDSYIEPIPVILVEEDPVYVP